MNTKPYKIHSSGYKTYSKRFKAECVARCLTGSQSVSSLAIEHGMSPNVLHRWVKEHRDDGRHDMSAFDGQQVGAVVEPVDAANTNWLAILPRQDQPTLALEKATSRTKAPISATGNVNHDISLVINSDKLSLKIVWPGSNLIGLAEFVKELMV